MKTSSKNRPSAIDEVALDAERHAIKLRLAEIDRLKRTESEVKYIFILPRPLYDKLEEEAQLRYVSKSKIVRDALALYLKMK